MNIKSLSVKMECGCTHTIGPDLSLRRSGLCQTHRLEKLHIGPDDVSMFDVSPSNSERETNV